MAAILILSGGGGPHALFSVALVRALAEAAYGETSYAHVGDMPAFRDAFLTRSGGAFVAFLEAPSPDCALVLRRSRTKVAVFPDAFETCVAFLMEQHGADSASAVRYATRGTASVADLARHADAGLVPEPSGTTRLAHHLRRLALFFGIEPSAPLIAAALERLGFGGEAASAIGYGEALARHLPATAGIAGHLAARSESEHDILRTIAPGYDRLRETADQAAGQDISWPSALCLLGDRPGAFVRGPIDLAGPARTLAYGPYLHLPAGRWQARVTLATGGNRSGNRVSIRFAGAGGERDADAFALPEEGRFEWLAEVGIETASEPLEMILRTAEGAIEGWIAIEAIAWSKQPQ